MSKRGVAKTQHPSCFELNLNGIIQFLNPERRCNMARYKVGQQIVTVGFVFADENYFGVIRRPYS